MQRERVRKDIPDERNSNCEDLEERESMKQRETRRNSLLIKYKIIRVPIMKGLISPVKDTGINPRNTAKLEKSYKQECDKITLAVWKYHPDGLIKVDMWEDRLG